MLTQDSLHKMMRDLRSHPLEVLLMKKVTLDHPTAVLIRKVMVLYRQCHQSQ